jgi:tellurite resistance protein
MSDRGAELVIQFREALASCKRLYIEAARVALQDQPGADESTRRDLIRRMVDLHQGLLVKIYTSVAQADRRWSRMERVLACELVEHLWQRRLEGDELERVAGRLFADAANLNWYSLLRPFDRIVRIRDFVPELETIVLRVANLVAKADGTVSTEETCVLQTIQHEVQVHLERIPLEDASEADRPSAGAQSSQIVTREPVLLPSRPAGPQEQQQQAPRLAHDSAETLDAELKDSLAQALADLDALIGLPQAKQEIKTLTNYLHLQQHRRDAGLPAHALSLHMVFRGNPGTGKTTVARIVGRIFRLLGLLARGHLIETDRAGLVAEYAGQTAPKANRQIDQALDGILFIDEAYSLVADTGQDAYGAEAVQALVKRMEDNRHRLVVILAGYPEPMDRLLASNPGLSSRFNTQLLFEDYLPVELAQIFQLMCEANHYQLQPAVRAKLLLGFHWLFTQRDEHFGNGRLVRNTFENTVRRLANRVAGVSPVTRDLLTVFTAEDVQFPDVPDSHWERLNDKALRFEVSCEGCGKQVLLRSDQLGRRVRCPHCRAQIERQWGEWVASP